MNRCTRTPDVAEDLGLPRGHDGIRHGDIDQRKHSRTVANVGDVSVGERSHGPIPIVGRGVGVEHRDRRLLRRARRTDVPSERQLALVRPLLS